MKNLETLGKVLDKKEQMRINGGRPSVCGRTLCLATCNNGLRLCANRCGTFYQPC